MRIIATLLLSMICVSIMTAQNGLVGTSVDDHPYDAILKSSLKSYHLFEMEVVKNELNFENVQSLFLSNGKLDFDLFVYPHSLSVTYKQNDIPHLLSGNSKAGGNVSLAIDDDYIFGYIRNGTSRLFIEPLWYFDKTAPKNLFVSYYDYDVIETEEHKCGAQKSNEKTKELDVNRMITDECVIVDYAIANAHDMVTEFGSVGDVETFNLAVLNTVQENYRSEFDKNIEYNVVANFIPATAGNDPFPSSSNAVTLLNFLGDWGDGGGNSGGSSGGFGVNYQMAGLWVDRDIFVNGSGSGVVGVAWTPGWHHVFENFTDVAVQLQVMVSHEIGHNWNADHDASGSPYIMAPSVTAVSDWSSVSVDDIDVRVAAQGFLDDCSDLGPPVANFFQSTIITCVGSEVEFEDQSQYGATRDWEFENGTPSTSINEKENVSFNTIGQHYVQLTSENNAGTDEYTYYVDVQDAPSIPCSPSGSGGGGGIVNVILENVSNASDNAATAGRFEDFACEQIIYLEASTNYDAIIGTSGSSSTNLRFYIDYNGDGDFTDSGELEGTWGLGGGNNYLIPFTTNSNPVEDQVIRFRIINDTGSITSSCENPTYSQVEDYGVVFLSDFEAVLGCTDPLADNYDPNANIDDGSCEILTTWYRDFDADGFGDVNNPQPANLAPPGYVADSSDCDDSDDSVYPGAPELCDGQLNNCNLSGLSLNEIDNDSDGYVECDYSASIWVGDPSVIGGNDCEDNNNQNYPGNNEICDGQDNNCDGITDEGCFPCDGVNLVISSILQNTYRAEESITSSTLVDQASDINFFAGGEIELTNNFEVTATTNFLADISTCIPTAFRPGGSIQIFSAKETKDKVLVLLEGLSENLDSRNVKDLKIYDLQQNLLFHDKLTEVQKLSNEQLNAIFELNEMYMIILSDGKNNSIGKLLKLN